MSSLSALLNPAPSSEAAAPSKPQQLAPLQLDGQDHRTHTHEPDYSHAQSPGRHTVTSPGLEVLAAAASSTAPLFSPTQQHSSMAQAMYQSQTPEFSGSASKDEPPSDTQEVSHHGKHQHPSGRPKYQRHESDGGQHVQDFCEDQATAFPPLHQSLSQQNPDSTMDDWSPSLGHSQDSSLPNQIPRPSYSDLPHLSNGSMSNQPETVDVKAEIIESSDVEMKDSSTLLPNTSTPVQHDATPGTPLKNVMSNASPPPTSQNGDSSALPVKPKVGPPKKRAAPRKGTAVKPPSKKRKIETESGKASPRTGTPATSRASGTPVPKKGKQESATPTRSSSVANPEDDDDDGELELFCICRKPDDHTVMIGCDGPCEDWFHTRCVNMTNEKVALISKWYCPNCAAEGHETEWKRMCRLDGCSKPARVEGPHRSKYCCNEHGQEFMSRHLSLNEKKAGGSNTNRRRRRDNYTDHDGNEADEHEEQEDNRGGVLRPGELKALVDGVKDVATFQSLGDGVLSPPETAATSPGHEVEKKIMFNLEETNLLDEIAKKCAEIEARKEMLNDRATLVQLVDLRRKNVLAKLKEKEKSLKDICGYDARLSWSDEELNTWRFSKEGRDQLHNAILDADPKFLNKEKDNEGEDAEIGPGVCKKKRCERHRTWYKIQQQDVAMEKEDVRQKLRKLDEEEKGVKDRAMIRSLEEGMEGGK